MGRDGSLLLPRGAAGLRAFPRKPPTVLPQKGAGSWSPLPHSAGSPVTALALGARPLALQTDQNFWHENKICSKEASCNPFGVKRRPRDRSKKSAETRATGTVSSSSFSMGYSFCAEHSQGLLPGSVLAVSPIHRGSPNSFLSGARDKYFRLCRPQGRCCKCSTLPLQHESRCRQYIDEEAGLCSNKTLFIKTGSWPDLTCPRAIVF